MKRQLKFRVWNGMEMIHDVIVGKFGVFYVNPGIDEDGLDEMDSATLTRFNTKYPDTTPTMQFTGLKDKNKKEIYEGDIVHQEKWVSVGKYVITTGVVKYKGIGFTCECVSDWNGSNADLNGNAIVIGNIYENPDLLN